MTEILSRLRVYRQTILKILLTLNLSTAPKCLKLERLFPDFSAKSISPN